MHYTGMLTGAAALERLCQPDAKVSAHYLIEEDGRIVRLVPEASARVARGCGLLGGPKTDINDRSIGIELVNPGHAFGYRAFPEAQMTALIDLMRGDPHAPSHPVHRVLGHSDVAPGTQAGPGRAVRLAAPGPRRARRVAAGARRNRWRRPASTGS